MLQPLAQLPPRVGAIGEHPRHLRPRPIIAVGIGIGYRFGGAMTVNSVDSSVAPQVVEIWY